MSIMHLISFFLGVASCCFGWMCLDSGMFSGGVDMFEFLVGLAAVVYLIKSLTGNDKK